MTGAAMLIPVAGLTLGFAGTAGAAGGKITCTGLNGTAGGTITISGCTGGNTGGSSIPVTATTLETGGTIHWQSGSSTTIGAPTLTTISATKCPGYVKKAASEPTAESVSIPVTNDSGDGILLPGIGTGEVCIGNDANATITLLKALKITWTKSTISCTTITGTAAGSVTVSGCTGGDTGGSSVSAPATNLEIGGTTNWVSGSSTTIGVPTLTTVSATHCPGYVKKAASEPSAESFTAVVNSDTGDGVALPGVAKGEVCIGNDANATISALKPLTLS
jgi:hypothetical protein